MLYGIEGRGIALAIGPKRFFDVEIGSKWDEVGKRRVVDKLPAGRRGALRHVGLADRRCVCIEGGRSGWSGSRRVAVV